MIRESCVKGWLNRGAESSPGKLAFNFNHILALYPTILCKCNTTLTFYDDIINLKLILIPMAVLLEVLTLYITSFNVPMIFKTYAFCL